MITSGNSGRPNLRLTVCAGTEVLAVKLLWDRIISRAAARAESWSFRWLATRWRMSGAGKHLTSCIFS